MGQWGSRVVGYARFLTGDDAAAQDIAQETFLRLYVFLGSHRGQAPTAGWLMTVAKHLAADESRRRRREVAVADPSGPGAVAEDLADSALVRDALSRLAPEDQECLYLFYYADLPSREIARHLNVPAATVRTRLMRARQRLWGVDAPRKGRQR